MHAHDGHSSPWKLDIRSLGRRPGTAKEYKLAIPAPERLGLDVIAVPEGKPVGLVLTLESVSEGVLVSGSAVAEAAGECSRCLNELTQPVRASLRELYAYPGSTTDETTEFDELPRVIDDEVDLLPLVRDEIAVALPIVPLCTPDCPGLCQECGIRLADAEQGHSHEILDPRWAALAEKFGSSEGLARPSE